MHVAMYSPSLPESGSPNGIVTYVRILGTELRALGHRVTVFSSDGIEYEAGLTEESPLSTHRVKSVVQRLRRKLLRITFPRLPERLTDTVKYIHSKYPVDIVEMEESFGLAGEMTIDQPIVIRLHGPHAFVRDELESPEVATISERRVEAEFLAIGSAAGVTCPSSTVLSATMSRLLHAPPKSRVILNPMPVAAIEACWSYKECDPDQLLFVGRFDRCKGADIIIQAFAIALETRPTLKLVMCGPDGGVSDENGSKLSYDEYAAQHLTDAIKSHIRFLGSVEPACVALLRLGSVLAVSTSRYDTFPYSLAEALAVGMPVLVAETVGIAKIIEDDGKGLPIPAAEPDVVANAILEALNDQSSLAAIGAAGRDLCSRSLSPSSIAAETVKFYESVLNR